MVTMYKKLEYINQNDNSNLILMILLVFNII